MVLRILFLSATFLLGLSAPLMAQDGKAGETVLKSPAKEKLKAQPVDPIKKWIDAENALLDTLSDKDKESFFILRNKHSIIRVIEIVKRDVGNAVKECGNKNPKMKAQMDTRFNEWKSAVMPIVDTAKKSLDRELSTQKIADEKQARNILKLNDEAYEYGESRTEKIPVTTPEACQGLLDSMDRTEDEMVTLLQETLLPDSVIRKRRENAVKSQNPPAAKSE